jgi:hypothetical protein
MGRDAAANARRPARALAWTLRKEAVTSSYGYRPDDHSLVA